MPLADGDPADVWDIWLRVITNKQHLRLDGATLKNNVFKGKVFAPPAQPRPWSYELSGRLLSLTVDFEAEGRAFCQTRDLDFRGVLYAQVELLRRIEDETLISDVRYTPIPNEDSAHADFVTFSTEQNMWSLRDWLQDNVKIAKHDNCVIASEFPKKTAPTAGA